MSNSMKRLGRRVALLTSLTALMVGAGAATAFASVNLSPPGPYAGTGTTTVTVSGTAPAGTETVAAAVCNTSYAPGTHCDINSASNGGELAPVSKYSTGLTIKVRRGESATKGWPSFNFTTGIPTPTTPATLCQNTTEAAAGTGTPCAVEVSFYKKVEGKTKQISSEQKAISFNP